jgi:hypothetical protein
MIVEVIEADLSPGDYFGMFGKSGEFFQMLRRDLTGFVRVNADGGVNPLVTFSEWQRGIEFFGAGSGADGQQSRDTGIVSALQHGFAVIRELREIDVGVRVDEFHFCGVFVSPLFQARAHFYIFQKSGENRSSFRADGSRDDHPVGFDSAEFAGR